MRPHGTPAALEARRRRAIALLERGFKVREVARKIGCSPTSVSRWKAEVHSGAPEALRPKPTPGRPSRLSNKQRTRLLTLLLKGARAHGYSTDLWTLPRVAEVIAKTFDVHYHPSHVWKILHGEGWSCQKPERQARERDEASIRKWHGENSVRSCI
jgi:transposase